MSADKHPEVTEQDELREQIEHTRAELGDTVQALSDKTDVKARVHDKVEETKEQVHEKVEAAKQQVHEKVESGRAQAHAGETPTGLYMAAGVALAIVAVVLVRTRRS